MKKFISTLSFILLVFVAFGQDATLAVKAGFNAYNQAIIDKKYSKALDHAPGNFFTIVSKEQMIKVMETTFNNPSMQFKIEPPIYKSVEQPRLIEGKYYAVINYISPISMKFIADEKEQSEQDKKSTQNLIRLSLENSFGKDQVKFNERNGFFDIKANKKAIAISPNGQTDWKYIVIDPKQAVMLQQLLPKSLLANLE